MLLDDFYLIYEDIVKYKLSIRQASSYLGIPKSTIHYRIHHQIKRDDPIIYRAICTQLKRNSLLRSKHSKDPL